MVRMKGLAHDLAWWPGIDKNIEGIAKSCEGCQEVQKSPEIAPLHCWEFPSCPWQRIHIDFAGPFHQKIILVIVDAHSKWPEVFVMSSTTAEKTISVLRSQFARFGVPEQFVSDSGPQFVSKEFERFTEANGIHHIMSAPYHPSTNGLAERFIQTFKKGISSFLENIPLQMKLDNLLQAYRNSPHGTIGQSPLLC